MVLHVKGHAARLRIPILLPTILKIPQSGASDLWKSTQLVLR